MRKSDIFSLLRHFAEPLSLIKMTVKLFCSLFFAGTLFGFFLVFTPQGATLAINLISDYTPYSITFTELQGRLISDLEIKELSLEGPKLKVKANTIKVGWHLSEIFKKDKTLDYLIAQQLSIWYQSENDKVLRLPVENTTETLHTVQIELNKTLPIPIKIKNIHIEQANIHWNEFSHDLNELIVIGATSELAKIEEIHYQGAFGTLEAYLQNAIKVNWDLKLVKNPYLEQFQTDAIITKGNIYLPSRQINDPKNQIQVHAQTKDFKFGKHRVENISLEIKGNLEKHEASMIGVYNNSPIDALLSGKLSTSHWHGKIEKLQVKHKRWEQIGNSRGTLDVDWHEKNVLSTIHILFSEQYPIDIQTTVSKSKPYKLSGSVVTHLNNIKTLAPLIPDLTNLRGSLDVDLQLQGTLLQPQWLGHVTLQNAKMRATTLGNNAFLNQLEFIFQENKDINVKGKGTWGSGPFSIDGVGKLSTQSMEVTIKGEKLLISDTSEYYIVANPDLKLTLKDKLMKVEGKIFIPHAEIQSLKSPDTISPSQDVVVISKNKPTVKPLTQRSFVTNIATDIELILSDNITYKGHGFSTKASGKLQIKQQPGQPPNAKGKLQLQNGKYKAYGKVFDIDYGQILFTGGPIYDPILDIRAQREIKPQTMLTTFQSSQTILAGIKFGGNLKSPKISFYSTPSMPDADIISYLIVGRPQHQVNEAQAELLFQAVSQLANIMGNSRKDVQFDLAEQLKLDQFGFSKKPNFIPTPGHHNPLEDTVFVLGKQLSDRLYLNYSVGIVDSASQLGLRYNIGKNVMIEAAAGTQGSSADVLLSFEGH